MTSYRKVLKKVAALSFNSKNEIVFGDKLGDAYTFVTLAASTALLAAGLSTDL